MQETTNQEISDVDVGHVIYHILTGTYYDGFNGFAKQPRNAKVYHSLKKLKETFDYYFEKNKNDKYKDLDRSHYAVCDIKICISNQRSFDNLTGV